MNRKKIILLYISLVVLVIFSIYSAYIQQNIFFAFLSCVIILIPAIISSEPLINEYKLWKNKNKNRLSNSKFTDRETDIETILNKLLIREHIIEISGFEAQCGKTWIAKKLCDCINHPKDNKYFTKKLPYKVSHYIDMAIINEIDLNIFLENNLINEKVVLIFDHVMNENLSDILSKQEQYHFQLIYILKEISNNYFFKYNVSNFPENHIQELQTKIRREYSGIQSINEIEAGVLFNITNGNIGSIHFILSHQNCVHWLVDIASHKMTEYEKKLEQIKIFLFKGEYETAKEELIKFSNEYKMYFSANTDLYYKYTLMKADCEHLLNHYHNALNTLSLIEKLVYTPQNKYELDLSKAHYYKHLWECDKALNILHSISPLYAAKVDSLGILLAKYFINDLHVPYTDQNSLNVFCDIYIDVEKNAFTSTKDEFEILKYQRYTAVYLYYREMPKNPEILLQHISEVISIYKSKNSRLLANAYFIRGEIYRLYKQYDQAVHDYAKCISITYDNNIIVQTNLIFYYLTYCKNLQLQYNKLSEDKIIELCKKNNYAKKIWNRLNSIILNDPTKEEIIKCFDNRIMPIL